jgi:protein-S-isoprenylcysteine O-methyltransferase Ste14
MKDLHRKALSGILRTFLVLLAAIFIAAGTLRYWQGWTCLAAFFVPACGISVYVAKRDPALLERRLKAGPKAEKEKGQKVVQVIASICFFTSFVISPLDHRFGWSSVPAFVSIAGDLMMLIGFAITFLVFKENTYTSGIIEVAENQTVVSTGPYAVVRHPMYSGALIMLFGIPLALGSWWGMLLNVPLTVAIAWRLQDEEKFLLANLTGYAQYMATVKYRLAPRVW